MLTNHPCCASGHSELPVRVLDRPRKNPASAGDPLRRTGVRSDHLWMHQCIRQQRSYDHRLVRLVQETGDTAVATRLGVPRSTAAGWRKQARRPVTTAAVDDGTVAALERRVAALEARVRR